MYCFLASFYITCLFSNKIFNPWCFHFRPHYNGIIPTHNSPSGSGLSSTGVQNGSVSPGVSVMINQTTRDALRSSNNNNNNNNSSSNARYEFGCTCLNVQFGTGSYVTVIEDRKLTVFPHILIKILARWEIVLTDDGQILCTLEFPQKPLPDVHLSSSHTFNLMTLKVIWC